MGLVFLLSSDRHPVFLLCTPPHILEVPFTIFVIQSSLALSCYIHSLLECCTVAALSSTIIVLVRVRRVTDVATRFPNFLLYHLLRFQALSLSSLFTCVLYTKRQLFWYFHAERGTSGTDLHICTLHAMHTTRQTGYAGRRRQQRASELSYAGTYEETRS